MKNKTQMNSKKYKGRLKIGDVWQNKHDNTIVVVSRIEPDIKGVWTATLSYTQSVTKQNLTFTIPCFDIERGGVHCTWAKIV